MQSARIVRMGEQSDQGGERKRAIVSENVMTATMQTLTPMSAEHVPVDITRMSLMQQHVFAARKGSTAINRALQTALLVTAGCM